MNSTFRSVIFTLVGLVIFFAISWLFFSIVPYLLVGGLIIYIVVKVKKNFANKNKSTNKTNENVYDSVHVQADPYEVKDEKVIDVDYKEINND